MFWINALRARLLGGNYEKSEFSPRIWPSFQDTGKDRFQQFYIRNCRDMRLDEGGF
jgi:hypothetical protein